MKCSVSPHYYEVSNTAGIKLLTLLSFIKYLLNTTNIEENLTNMDLIKFCCKVTFTGHNIIKHTIYTYS